MDKKATVFLTGIIVLLVFSITPFAFNEAFALPATGPIGDFRCFDGGLDDPGNPLPDITGITLQDQFGTIQDAKIGTITGYCLSGAKTVGNIVTDPWGLPGQHFTLYDLKENPPITPRTGSATLSQFGITTEDFTVFQPSYLMVPTTKTFLNNQPSLSLSQTDLHFICYNIGDPTGVGDPELFLPTFSLETQLATFVFPESQFSSSANTFCTPAIKTNPSENPSVFGALIQEHFLCITKTGGGSVNIFHTIDQFSGGQARIGSTLANQVCLEALKDFPEVQGCMTDSECDDTLACTIDSCNIATGMCVNTPDDSVCDDGDFCNGIEICVPQFGCEFVPPNECPIGGEILTVGSTSVLAAGAQYTAAWMIPVIVSAIGIGIVIARKF